MKVNSGVWRKSGEAQNPRCLKSSSVCWQALWRCCFHFPVGLGKSWLIDRGATVFDWPENLHNPNPIENLWSIVKREDKKPQTQQCRLPEGCYQSNPGFQGWNISSVCNESVIYVFHFMKWVTNNLESFHDILINWGGPVQAKLFYAHSRATRYTFRIIIPHVYIVCKSKHRTWAIQPAVHLGDWQTTQSHPRQNWLRTRQLLFSNIMSNGQSFVLVH